MPNHYYFYILDRDFGPLFIKFCSSLSVPAKLCLNGHEWLKRQLTHRDVPFEPLDNGIRSSDAPARVQRIADTLDAAKIDAVFRKWLRRLPHPFASRAPRGRLSVSALDSAKRVRADPGARSPADRTVFLRRNPSRKSRHRSSRSDATDFRSARHTPHAGRASARACSLRESCPRCTSQYKKSKVKQSRKEGQALRTETTINDTYAFAIGRALRNLPALREIGFAANRRLLHVESLSHDCLIGDDDLARGQSPVARPDQRAAGPAVRRPPGPRAHARALSLCTRPHRLSSSGAARSRRTTPEPRPRAPIGGAMTYDLRRLRLHGLIERVPHSHRYRITLAGAQVAMFYARLYARALRPVCSLQRVAIRSCAARLRSSRRRARPFPGGGETCGLKNLTQTLLLLGVKTPRRKRPSRRESIHVSTASPAVGRAEYRRERCQRIPRSVCPRPRRRSAT